ncbi:hypothetical protein M0805_000446 [Coniferiporia weirii]|nr:hypothetical protein M0805_000446 [Coniferiporia weirii]
MPRKRNQTRYDGMMSVFKQGPVRSETQRDYPCTEEDIRAPMHHTSRTQDQNFPFTLAGDASPALALLGEMQLPSYTDGTSPHMWNKSSMTAYPPYDNVGSLPVSGYENAHCQAIYSFDPPPSHLAPSFSSASSSETLNTGQWIVRIFPNGQGQNLSLSFSVEKFQIPYAQCVCGVHLRFLHLPTLVPGDWQPNVGVLWNFRRDESNVWLEGEPYGDCVSLVRCPAPACCAQLRLYGPCS